MVLVIAGCDDDDDELTPEQKLVGTWTITQAEVDMFVGTQSLTDFLVDVLDFTPVEAAAFVALFEDDLSTDLVGSITFNANNSYTANLGGDPGTGVWEISANGSTLTLDKGTADEVVLTVTSLTTTTLNVTLEQELTEDLDDEPSTPETSVLARATVEFTKS
jgi:hypothetical protein